MSTPSLQQLLRGPFNFFSPTAEELRELFPEHLGSLPLPQQVFLEDENSTPIYGFPILQSSGMRALLQGLEEYLQTEEELQVAMLRRQAYDRKVYGAAWERYRAPLARWGNELHDWRVTLCRWRGQSRQDLRNLQANSATVWLVERR